jgi:threonine dehydrogenase-like Zn-dependent dehydrogenase
MKGLYFDGKFSLRDLPRPELRPGEALIRMNCAGICNTDLEIIQGYMAFRGVLGHEFVGRIAACDDSAWIGKRVVGEINLPCRQCSFCRAGMGNHCPNRKVLGILGKDGAFAEYLTLPVKNLHPVPDSVSDLDAVFTEPLAAALEILEQVEVQNFKKCVVLGDGKLGQLIARVLKPHCPDLTVIGKHENKLDLLRRVGIKTRMMEKIIDWVEDLENQPDLVVEATGSTLGLGMALELVRPRGTLVLKSTFHGRTSLDLSPVVVNEITLIGSRCGPFAKAIALLASGRLDLTPLITRVLPLDQGLEAVEIAQAKGTLKVILKGRV